MYRRHVGRLPGFHYLGPYRYFLTFCVSRRQPVLVTDDIVNACVQEFLRAARCHGFEITAYCMMPDHVHLLVTGLADNSHLPPFAALAKQLSGFRCRRCVEGRLWQDGYYDHVLRDDESTAHVARYLLENPVRRGLVRLVTEYPYIGSQTYTREQLIEWAYMNWETQR